jgi:hypothetical protein
MNTLGVILVGSEFRSLQTCRTFSSITGWFIAMAGKAF